MVGASCQEVRAKSALNRSAGPRASWTLNPYRGCPHACRYCYARATHSYLDLDCGRDFERVLLAKVNLPELLRRELARSRSRGQTVVIGTAADPYQPIESRYRLTRQALKALADFAAPTGLLTKGTLIVGDVDVLQELSRRTRLTIHFSITTLDPDLARRLEPGAPPPRSRLRALAQLREAGIPAGVLLCPILPGVTDSAAQIEQVVRATVDAGAIGLWGGALRLAPLVREQFLPFLDRERPDLSAAYRRLYARGADATRAYRDLLDARVAEIKARHGLVDPPEDDSPEESTEQLSLPLPG